MREGLFDRLDADGALRKWSRENFPGSQPEQDQLPDPVVNQVKILAQSSKNDLIFQRIETSVGQFVRVIDKTGKVLSLTLDV